MQQYNVILNKKIIGAGDLSWCLVYLKGLDVKVDYNKLVGVGPTGLKYQIKPAEVR
jgi:hypothetical protein